MIQERCFLGWDKPLLKLAVEKLSEGWTSGHLDLSSLLIVVSTREAGRKLRMALASFAGTRGMGVLPPRVVTPEYFLLPPSSRKTLANNAEILAVLTEVLREFNLDRLNSLFPVAPVSRNDIGWAVETAEKICGLRNMLAENGLNIDDVLRHPDSGIEELDRWRDLAEIEKAYLEKLGKLKLRDINSAERESVLERRELNGISKIILIGISDAIPLVFKKIGKIAEEIPVKVWIHAPESLEDTFDEWGCPIPGNWLDYEIEFPENGENIRLADTPESQGDMVTEILCGLGSEISATDIGIFISSGEFFPYLEKSLSNHGVKAHNPAGEFVSQSSIFHLLQSFSILVSSRDYESFTAVLRNPDFLRYLVRRNPEIQSAVLLASLDEFQKRHMPANLGKMKSLFSAGEKETEILRTALEDISALIEAFESKPFILFVRDFLSGIYSEREFAPGENETDRKFCEITDIINGLLVKMETLAFKNLRLDSVDSLKIFLRLLSYEKIYGEHPCNALDIQGWLEAPWENAGCLIIAGMNEKYLPESVIVGDVFLPDLPRSKLGLKSNDKRFARDIYLFASMIKSRREGAVYCIVGKRDISGEPLKPSRLLFNCGADVLAKRAELLFKDVKPPLREWAGAQPLWRLRPQEGKDIEEMSVTAFRDYLACPFRFYLKRSLKMEHADDRKKELDSLDFGDICHKALEKFGKNRKLRGSTDEGEIGGFLISQAEKLMEAQFGTDLSLPLTVQFEGIRQRLLAAAKIQTEEALAGWKIVETEYRLGAKSGEDGLEFNAMLIHGKIDRIDRHEDGTIRILDYKTNDSPQTPEHSHTRGVNIRSHSPDYALYELNGKTKMWTDLQIPLYRILLEREGVFKGDKLLCGYFNLPKAAGQTGIKLWENLEIYKIHAQECAKKIIDNIKNKVFWPPAEQVDYDDFKELFFKQAAELVEEDFCRTF